MSAKQKPSLYFERIFFGCFFSGLILIVLGVMGVCARIPELADTCVGLIVFLVLPVLVLSLIAFCILDECDK